MDLATQRSKAILGRAFQGWAKEELDGREYRKGMRTRTQITVVHRTGDGGGVGKAEHPYLGKGRTMVREGKVKQRGQWMRDRGR